MIGFEISIDGEKICTAGVETGVVSAIASFVRRASQDAETGQLLPDRRFEEEVTFDVGGFAREPDGSAVNVTWIAQPLVVGQTITLTVVDIPQADPPRNQQRNDPAVVERQKREYYERLKKEYGE